MTLKVTDNHYGRLSYRQLGFLFNRILASWKLFGWRQRILAVLGVLYLCLLSRLYSIMPCSTDNRQQSQPACCCWSVEILFHIHIFAA